MSHCRTAFVALAGLALCAPAAGAGEACNTTMPCDKQAMEFCGRDGTCRVRSCEAYYEFGDVRETGYDSAEPVPLQCRSALGDPSVDSIGVVFGCKAYANGAEPEAQEAVVLRHSRKCVAEYASGRFECTDMAGTTSSDFRAFVNTVENTVLLPCANNAPAQYIYQAERVTYRDQVEKNISMSGANSSALNETLALRAVRTEYIFSTTQMPSTAAPTTSAPSASSRCEQLNTTACNDNQRCGAGYVCAPRQIIENEVLMCCTELSAAAGLVPSVVFVGLAMLVAAMV